MENDGKEEGLQEDFSEGETNGPGSPASSGPVQERNGVFNALPFSGGGGRGEEIADGEKIQSFP